MTPSPTIATTRPSACSAGDDRRPCRPGSTSATTSRRCRPRRRPPRGGAVVVAGEQHRPQARARAAARPPAALVGLTVSATTSDAAGRAVPADGDRGAARRPRPRVDRGRRASSAQRAGDHCGRPATPAAARPRRACRPSTTPRRPRPSVRGEAPSHRAAARRPGVARPPRRPRGRSGAREASSTAPASRQHLVLGRLAGRRRRPSTSAIRPVVTVPVLSSTTVSTRRVDSSTSGPLIRMPSCAPRPVPTSSAVGVARPSAHGQAMISTATAAVNAAVGAARRRAASRPAWPATSTITTGTNTADTRSASRCTCALPLCAVLDQPGHLRELGVGADPGGAHHQPAAGVDGRADHRVARADLDRHRLAGEHRGVDRRGAARRPAVGRDLLARAYDELVADRELRRPAPARSTPSRSTATSLAPSASSARSAAPDAALGARLEVAAGQQERRDRRRRPRGRSRRPPCARTGRAERHPSCPASRRRRRTARTATSRTPRARRARPGCPWWRRRAGRWSRPRGGTASAPQTHDRGGEGEREPLPVVELQRRDHRQQQHRHGEHGGRRAAAGAAARGLGRRAASVPALAPVGGRRRPAAAAAAARRCSRWPRRSRRGRRRRRRRGRLTWAFSVA